MLINRKSASSANKGYTIWIFQTGEPVHTDSAQTRAMRAMNLSDALTQRGYKVVLWTSDFDHYSKKKRFGKFTKVKFSESLEIRFVPSLGYKKHVSLARILDHFLLAINLQIRLQRQAPPDLAVIGFPPIESSWVMSNWLSRRSIPYLVDIKDAWPEVIIIRFPLFNRFFFRQLLFPFFYLRRRTLLGAKGIMTITEDFLAWLRTSNDLKIGRYDLVTPLVGKNLEESKNNATKNKAWLDEMGIGEKGPVRLFFIGSLSSVFDFRPIIEAARLSEFQFVICGDGPLKRELETASERLPNLILLGRVSQFQADLVAKNSTFALIPIRNRHDFNLSLPNKFFDALRVGKPIISTNYGVLAKKIKEWDIGYCYDGNASDLLQVVNRAVLDPERLEKMSKNAKTKYVTEFNYDLVYSKAVTNIEHLLLLNQRKN